MAGSDRYLSHGRPGLLRCRSMRGEKFWVKIPRDVSNHRNLGRDFLDCQKSKMALVQPRPRRRASSARSPKHLAFGAPSWSARCRGAINQIEIRQYDRLSASMSQARAVVLSDGRSFVRSSRTREHAESWGQIGLARRGDTTFASLVGISRRSGQCDSNTTKHRPCTGSAGRCSRCTYKRRSVTTLPHRGTKWSTSPDVGPSSKLRANSRVPMELGKHPRGSNVAHVTDFLLAMLLSKQCGRMSVSCGPRS